MQAILNAIVRFLSFGFLRTDVQTLMKTWFASFNKKRRKIYLIIRSKYKINARLNGDMISDRAILSQLLVFLEPKRGCFQFTARLARFADPLNRHE